MDGIGENSQFEKGKGLRTDLTQVKVVMVIIFDVFRPNKSIIRFVNLRNGKRDKVLIE
jgi:hypothetical protein